MTSRHPRGGILSLLAAVPPGDIEFARPAEDEPPPGPPPAVGRPYEWGHTITLSRGMALDLGLVDPTPQEAADQAERRAWARGWHAEQIQRRAEWFSAVRDAAGPVAAAMLDLHVPDELLDDCEGCTVDTYDGRVSWPCATVLAAADAVTIPAPDGI